MELSIMAGTYLWGWSLVYQSVLVAGPSRQTASYSLLRHSNKMIGLIQFWYRPSATKIRGLSGTSVSKDFADCALMGILVAMKLEGSVR